MDVANNEIQYHNVAVNGFGEQDNKLNTMKLSIW